MYPPYLAKGRGVEIVAYEVICSKKNQEAFTLLAHLFRTYCTTNNFKKTFHYQVIQVWLCAFHD